jgi:hypothetical protein
MIFWKFSLLAITKLQNHLIFEFRIFKISPIKKKRFLVALVTEAHKEYAGCCFCSTSQVLMVVANAGQNEPGATNALVGRSVHTGWAAFFHSARHMGFITVHLFLFADHCTFSFFFGSWPFIPWT